MADLATTVHTAAMPSQLRQMVRKWYSNDVVQRDPVTIAKMHVSAAVEGIRGTGESAVMGSILGAFHAMNPTGLDLNVPGTKQKVPVDAVAAVVGLLGGVGAASASHGMGKTVANAGFACAAVFGFRQTNDLIVKLRKKKTGVDQASNRLVSKAEFGAEGGWADGSKSWVASHHGDAPSFGAEDPILKAARSL